ncbi:MAG: hypothetical protein NC300_02445 [Bacteroidales bacterium]|nr:hypothetical protein [Clostridium sp.]MCM1202984.1 hypothetical protein [Bacteroidales bacterium]
MADSFVDYLDIFVPSIITIVGFFVNNYFQKLNIKREISKIHMTNYMENYKNIEYDISEILQLAIKVYLGNKEYNKLEYKIQKYREGELKLTKEVSERLYRLGGYISTYGSKQSVNYLNRIRMTYYENRPSMVEEYNKEEFCKFAILLAKLLIQTKIFLIMIQIKSSMKMQKFIGYKHDYLWVYI